MLIGAGAKILGAITVGRGSQVAAGSLVLKPVAPRTMVAGSPATQIGTVSGAAPAACLHTSVWRLSHPLLLRKQRASRVQAVA